VAMRVIHKCEEAMYGAIYQKCYEMHKLEPRSPARLVQYSISRPGVLIYSHKEAGKISWNYCTVHLVVGTSASEREGCLGSCGRLPGRNVGEGRSLDVK
jgi:hypothetical protein